MLQITCLDWYAPPPPPQAPVFTKALNLGFPFWIWSSLIPKLLWNKARFDHAALEKIVRQNPEWKTWFEPLIGIISRQSQTGNGT